MKRILAAIDGSEASKPVVELTASLAKSMSASVTLLFVVPALGVPSDYAQYARTEKVDTAGYYDEVGRRVVESFATTLHNAGVECEPVYEIGPAFQKILARIESSKADIVILGLRGLHGVGRIRALGSTARRVMENSPVPVVIVPS
jgi:nucleotide-binding universal stress UspA family protein